MSCPEVMTQTGLVRGFECNGVFKFRGVPYCKPTTGEGRFKPAQAAEPWNGVLDCKKHRSLLKDRQIWKVRWGPLIAATTRIV